MNGFLLDTNVISELTKPTPHESVIEFLAQDREFWISTVTLHELAFGIALMSAGKRRDAIAQIVDDFAREYQDRIILVGQDEAHEAAQLRARAQKSGQTIPLGDALIAGVASNHRLVVVTRNVSDFQGLGVEILNPWQEHDGER